MMNQQSSPQRLQPLVAWQAIRRLMADPEQTHEVFTIIRALSGNALQRGFQRFRRTTTGQQILAERRVLIDTLNDREHLAALPADSLGRHYLSFVVRENITADGLVDASAGGQESTDADLLFFSERQRDMHDLWHTLTEYGRDELGEACLLAFTYAQSRNRGIGFICVVGCYKLSRAYGAGVFRAAWQGYRAGKKAAWLPAADWEALLEQPIDSVRRDLRIEPPRLYQGMFNAAVA